MKQAVDGPPEDKFKTDESAISRDTEEQDAAAKH